jgi:hypothetical protein
MVYKDILEIKNGVFRRNMTSKEERVDVRDVACNSGCHPQ